ncbi:hypothetical protein GGF46_004498 [Coemansia sp. RSA 552]|nr:hypothetical protein GGF46_004498 [Coemansia sp. RSA 552]
MQVLAGLSVRALRRSQSQLRGFATRSWQQQQQQAVATQGLVLGMFSSQRLVGGEAAKLSQEQQQAIVRQAQAVGFKAEAGKVQTVLGTDLAQQIALVGLGGESADGAVDARDTTVSEVVRTAVGNGIRQLQARKVTDIGVAPLPHIQAAAEGAGLAQYKFDAFKSKASSAGDKTATVNVRLLEADSDSSWVAGRVYADAQNLARDLMNTPANYMTPAVFADRVTAEMADLDGVQVKVHDKAWAEAQRMGGLLTVAKGSSEPLRFVEIVYRGKADSTATGLALVGKGITFDTGGYSLKPGRFMDGMKGDMGGGATVVAAMRAIAQLRLPINVAAVVPLCENMISGGSAKVSDVYTSRAGLTVEVMNTDAEGRIVLADALHYVIEEHRPDTVVDVATLTGAMVVALGELYTGVFTPSPRLWDSITAASHASDEPVWRMPLHDRWDSMLKSPVADLSNIGDKSEAGACTAAAFLRQFVHGPRLNPPTVQRDQNNDHTSRPLWAHLDIAGPMEAAATTGYHYKGMSGRPTRLLIELAHQMSQPSE